MSLASLIKRLQDIMRKDSGVDGDAQRLAQIVWLIFLKVYDYKEEEAELDDNYVPVIPKGYHERQKGQRLKTTNKKRVTRKSHPFFCCDANEKFMVAIQFR